MSHEVLHDVLVFRVLLRFDPQGALNSLQFLLFSRDELLGIRFYSLCFCNLRSLTQHLLRRLLSAWRVKAFAAILRIVYRRNLS